MKKILILTLLATVFLALPARAQRFGQDSIRCITNLSLYIEDYKLYKEGTGSEESLENMLRSWRWVFHNCPEATENIYVDGPTMIELMIGRAGNEAEKAALIDTLGMMYDQRIKYFGKEGFVLGRKGVDIYTKDPSRFDKVFPDLKRSVELEGNESSAAVLVYYFRIAAKMVQTGKLESSELVDIYDRVSTIVENNLKTGKRSSSFENAQRNVELTFEPYASCDDLVRIYQAKFDESPDDPDLLRKILSVLDKKGCAASELFFNVSVRLYELEPNAESAYLIGKMYIRRGNQSRAIKYLQEGTRVEDPEERADCYLLLANALLHEKSFSQAREAALESARLRPQDGRPYLLIGDMYAASAASCGDNKLTERVAYWAAVDKYLQARNVDPTLEKEANEKIATYSRYYPEAQDIFFYELEEGMSYTVGCWINEVTTVRALKQ